MNRWFFSAASLSVVLLCTAPPTAAADAISDAVLACTAETSDARRLACFDALADRLRGRAEPVAAVTPTTAAAAPTTAAAAPAAAGGTGRRCGGTGRGDGDSGATSSGSHGAAATAGAVVPQPEGAPLSAEERFGLP